MKKYLIRSGISPLEVFDPAHMILQNSIGGNVGNLVYAFGVYKTLMTDDVVIEPDYYKIDPSQASYINENYDAYIIPLADAFRNDFVSSLRNYTKLIKKLKIPVYVIGVGLRAPFEPKLDESFEFDNEVKEFVKAVLEKSSIIGVRGEITSEYLSRLGFQEGIDHMAIGCPSMYSFGSELAIRETAITPESLVCVNSSRLSPNNVLDFITKSTKEFSNHYFIPQWLKELRMTYLGFPEIQKSGNNYPGKMSDEVYVNNRVRYFLNVPTWLDFLSKADLAFGARLHGNIAATIAGTPSILIPKDGRMRELTEYHHLTHIWAKDIKEDTSIWDVIEKADFHQVSKYQAANFDRFIDFLNKNNIDHIYKEGYQPSHIPFNDKLSNVHLLPPLEPLTGCSVTETIQRFETFSKLEDSLQVKQNQEHLKKLNQLVSKKDKQIKHLQGTLNRKSTRLALKVANMFGSQSK